MDIKLECQELDIKEMSSLINRLRIDNDAMSNIVEDLRKENQKLKEENQKLKYDLSDYALFYQLLKKENSCLRSQVDVAVVGFDRISHMGCYEVSREVSIRLDKIRQIRREGE